MTRPDKKTENPQDGPRNFKKVKIPSRELTRYAFKPKATNPIRRTKEYRAFHKEMIGLHPVCAKKDCDQQTTDIHHIKRITDNPDLALDPQNIICTCEKCHHLIESAVNRGVDAAIWNHLFEGL